MVYMYFFLKIELDRASMKSVKSLQHRKEHKYFMEEGGGGLAHNAELVLFTAVKVFGNISFGTKLFFVEPSTTRCHLSKWIKGLH